MVLAGITRIDVVGAGTMGAGIAEVFADASYEVLWYNRSEAGMQRGLARLRANQATLIRHGVRTQEAADMAWMRPRPTHTLQDLASVDLVSESITEHREAKQDLFYTFLLRLLHMKQASALDERDTVGEDTPGV